MDPSRFLPPPGGDKSTAINLLSVTWFFTSLASVTVLLKIWTRVKLIRQWGLDDILTAFSTVSESSSHIKFDSLHESTLLADHAVSLRRYNHI